MKFRQELVGGTKATLILSVLNTGPAYLHEIIQRINDLSEGILDWQEGIVSPVLHRLECMGLIAGHSVQIPNGGKRRVYSITEDGRQALAFETREWSVYSQAVGSILEASYA